MCFYERNNWDKRISRDCMPKNRRNSPDLHGIAKVSLAM